jgi:hypothetical protein
LFEGDGIGASGLIKFFSLRANLNASGIVCVKVSMFWRIWLGGIGTWYSRGDQQMRQGKLHGRASTSLCFFY